MLKACTSNLGRGQMGMKQHRDLACHCFNILAPLEKICAYSVYFLGQTLHVILPKFSLDRQVSTYRSNLNHSEYLFNGTCANTCPFPSLQTLAPCLLAKLDLQTTYTPRYVSSCVYFSCDACNIRLQHWHTNSVE